MMKLYVKYMVSRRCVLVVRCNLEEVGIPYSSVQLGLIETAEDLPPEKIEQLERLLAKSSLKLIVDKSTILIEQIKTCVRELVHHNKEGIKVNFSTYLSKKLNHNYTYMANVFSEIEGITIEHFIIIHRIERIKELLLYDELTLTEIAYKMDYSSVSYLSYQFKKVTGLTPTAYKKLSTNHRCNIEDL